MSEQVPTERQNTLLRNEREVEVRTQDAAGLVHDIIGRHQEYFAEPKNRLEFIKEQSADEFLSIARYVNAKLRSETPHQLKYDENEKGSFLPMLHTPSHEDKPAAFASGYEAIQEYIETSEDSESKKIEGVAMATEALVIWTHLFNDGNGRTSRFLGRLVEDGAANVDELVAQTAAQGERNRIYPDKYATREGRLSVANNQEIMLDDEEREEMRTEAKRLPSDVTSMKLSIKNLLESDDVRQRTLRYVKLKDESVKVAA